MVTKVQADIHQQEHIQDQKMPLNLSEIHSGILSQCQGHIITL